MDTIRQIITLLQGYNPNFGQIVPVAIANGQAVHKTLGLCLYLFGLRIFTYADFGLLWLVFVLAGPLYMVWRSELGWLYLFVWICLLMVFAVLCGQTHFVFLVDGTSVNRLVMHLAPAAFYLTMLTVLRDPAWKDVPAALERIAFGKSKGGKK